MNYTNNNTQTYLMRTENIYAKRPEFERQEEIKLAVHLKVEQDKMNKQLVSDRDSEILAYFINNAAPRANNTVKKYKGPDEKPIYYGVNYRS